jgi:putative aldouronate transport system substrate-binding protein
MTSPKWTEFQSTSTDILTRALTEAVKAKSDEDTKKIWNKFIEDWNSQGGKDATAEISNELKKMYK